MLVDLGVVPVQEHVVLLPAQDPAPPPQGEEFGEASPIALVVVLLLAVATALLIRNMSKRIKRLPASFDEPEVPPQEDGPRAVDDTEQSGSGRT